MPKRQPISWNLVKFFSDQDIFLRPRRVAAWRPRWGTWSIRLEHRPGTGRPAPPRERFRLDALFRKTGRRHKGQRRIAHGEGRSSFRSSRRSLDQRRRGVR